MEKKALYDGYVQLEATTQAMLKQIQSLKQATAGVLERNAELEIENRHLRARLQEVQGAAPQTATGAAELSKSKLNLENLYEEGFHVCPYMYGQRRLNDEPCAFCLEIIYGEH